MREEGALFLFLLDGDNIITYTPIDEEDRVLVFSPLFYETHSPRRS